MKAGVILGAFVAVILLILSAVFGSWYIIDQGERGVIVRNGSVVGTADPGLHFKMPFMDSVERISVQSKSRVYAKGHGNSRDQLFSDLHDPTCEGWRGLQRIPQRGKFSFPRYRSPDACGPAICLW